MKKKLAILLAAVMVAAMVPVSAFATSTNYLTGQAVTVTKDTVLAAGDAAQLAIEDNKGDLFAYNGVAPNQNKDIVFELNLTNATWSGVEADPAAVPPVVATGIFAAANLPAGTTTKKVTDSSIVVTIAAGTYAAASTKIYFPMLAKVTAEAEATVTINPVGACPVAGGTYTFAIGAGGSTVTTIEKTTTLSESALEIKPITIVETAPGSLKDTQVITLKVSKDFKFTNTLANPIVVAKSYGSASLVLPALPAAYSDQEIKITVANVAANAVSKVVISGLDVIAKDSADEGDVCEITVSGAGVTKTTVEAGSFAEYGYTFVVEDKTLPVFYSGSNVDNDSLKVTFKESVLNSWVASRKTTFTFPDGVKPSAVALKKVSNVNNSAGAALTAADFTFDGNKAYISGCATTGKAELQMVFTVSVSPEFTGDIKVTCGGSAVEKDTELVIGKAEMPFTVEVENNEVNIDYRNVAVGNITIKEAYAGALETGTTLRLAVENMDFEKGFKWEVTEGDLDVKSIKETANGKLDILIKSESGKTPGTIVISDIELYLDRSLPAGNYALNAEMFSGVPATDAFFKNYASPVVGPTFDVDEVTVADKYVKVITAGRDQDDSTFTTQISVPIGAYEIKAGTKTVALDTPAYINEAGYTMMPLRGVVEALSGSAIISWDDATKTVTILFGTRVISMTIGAKSMVINGTAIAMTSAPVIVNSRTFLPLRDLGYALGLGDSKIKWDDTTKTATLN